MPIQTINAPMRLLVIPAVPFDVMPMEAPHIASKLDAAAAASAFASTFGTTVMSKSLPWATTVLTDPAVPINVIGANWRVRQLHYRPAALCDKRLPVGRLRACCRLADGMIICMIFPISTLKLSLSSIPRATRNLVQHG